MANSRMSGIILLVIAVTLSYWLLSCQGKSERVETKAPAIEKDALSDSNAPDSVNAKDHRASSTSASPAAGDRDADGLELPKLYGITITKDDKMTIFYDPLTKSTGIYRINDSISGFIVSDILQDKVLLLRDDKQFEVHLRDPKDVRSVSRDHDDEEEGPLKLTKRKGKRPLRPNLPLGMKYPPMGPDNLTTEESHEKEESEVVINRRFWRRPEHEEMSEPLTPVPPVPATFD